MGPRGPGRAGPRPPGHHDGRARPARPRANRADRRPRAAPADAGDLADGRRSAPRAPDRRDAQGRAGWAHAGGLVTQHAGGDPDRPVEPAGQPARDRGHTVGLGRGGRRARSGHLHDHRRAGAPGPVGRGCPPCARGCDPRGRSRGWLRPGRREPPSPPPTSILAAEPRRTRARAGDAPPIPRRRPCGRGRPAGPVLRVRSRRGSGPRWRRWSAGSSEPGTGGRSPWPRGAVVRAGP